MMKLKSIGVIRTPYAHRAPYQPVEKAPGVFRLLLHKPYAGFLKGLERFKYAYVIYWLDRSDRGAGPGVTPPWSGEEVGIFASRSPDRPNPLGLSVVRIKKISGTEVVTSGLDVFDKTPLLDIKPYLAGLDSKKDAGYGWLEKKPGARAHFVKHLNGEVHITDHELTFKGICGDCGRKP